MLFISQTFPRIIFCTSIVTVSIFNVLEIKYFDILEKYKTSYTPITLRGLFYSFKIFFIVVCELIKSTLLNFLKKPVLGCAGSSLHV